MKIFSFSNSAGVKIKCYFTADFEQLIRSLACSAKSQEWLGRIRKLELEE
jgi:hypothetical protein